MLLVEDQLALTRLEGASAAAAAEDVLDRLLAGIAVPARRPRRRQS